MSFATPQLLFDGLLGGLVTGLLAASIVLVHRSTKVVNFAAAAMGLVGSALLALLTVRYHVPYALALPLALLAGTAFGAAVELSVVRRLFTAPRVIVPVATIGVAQLALVIAASFPSLDAGPGRSHTVPRYPLPFSGTWTPIPGLTVSASQLAVLAAVPPVVLGLGALLARTSFGLAVRAAADRPELARLHGISPKLASTLVWAAAGFLAALAMILVAGQQGSAVELARLGPQTLLRALAAAALARLVSIPVALGAGLAIGVGEALVRFHTLGQPGLPDLLLLLLVVAASLRGRGRGSRTADREAGSVWTHAYTPRVRPVPASLQRLWWVRHLNKAGPLLLCAAGIALPLAVTQPSRIMLWTTALAMAVCAASLTVTTGWAGQLSLGQMAFAGIGALSTATLHRGVRLDLGPLGVLALRGMVLPVAIVVAATATAALSVLLAPAVGSGTGPGSGGPVRARGLGAAAGTFAFAVAAEQFLYRQPFFTGEFGQSVPLPRTTFLGLDITSPRAYYYLVLAVLVLVLGTLAHLRRTAAGRATIAVRDNPDAAAAWGVAPVRTTLRAFALAGFTAGVGGALLAGAVQAIPWSDRFFLSGDSLLLVSVAVIGGLGSPTGPVLGAAWLTGVPALFPDSGVAPMLTSSVGLLVLLMYFPGGLAQLGHGVRDALLGWAERRHPAEPGPPLRTAAALVDVRERARAPRGPSAPAPAGRPLLAVTGIRVRFGGIVAVDGVDLEVRAGETVGLIGSNGAGKSTLMDAIGGFTHAEGSVTLAGRDLSRLSPARRARAGLGRGFQSAALFPELTVREAVCVALGGRHDGRRRAERALRAEAGELIGFLGLGEQADALVADLSTGTRRIAGLAGMLALRPRLLCLDEPTAGLAQRETEAFGPLIQRVRRELDAALLVIEHDMPLVLGISDRVYCLGEGRVIASGPPEAVRRDPGVITSYLGADPALRAPSPALPVATPHPRRGR